MDGERILVTGGTGFLGSHACIALRQAGCQVVAFDNLSNSDERALTRMRDVAGTGIDFVRGDLRDADALERAFAPRRIDAVLHFAGLKSVPQSRLRPAEYHENNVEGTARLCAAMRRHGVHRLVFSSSASVYGDATCMPLTETSELVSPTSPYAAGKLEVERRLHALAAAEPRWSIALLRYFNPAGAHDSGRIGDDSTQPAEDLLSCLARVATAERDALQVFGGDYPTRDGTCVRDYVHVMDLADAHVAALAALEQRHGVEVWNLGSGRGFSVLEMTRPYERVSGVPIPWRIVARRPGDVASSWADASKARRELGWQPRRSLDQMIADQYRWSRRARG
jgi:UDP-glucose 4-epimerase